MRFFGRFLRSRTVVLVAGKFSLTIAQGAVLIVLGRSLGAGAVGTYTLALAIVSPFFLFGHLRLQDKLASDPEAETRWPEYRNAMALGGLAAFILSVLIAAIYPTPGLFSVAVPLALARLSESYAFMVHGYWQGLGRMRMVAGANVSRSAGLVVGTVVGLLGTGQLSGAVWGAALVSLAITPMLEGRERIRQDRRGNLRQVWRIVRNLAPLGGVAVLLSMNQTVVRLVIERSVGVAELGIFAATAYLVRIGSILAQAIGQARSPEIRQATMTGDRRSVARHGLHSALIAALVGCAAAVGMIAMGPWLMLVAFGEDFVPARVLIAAIFAAGIPLFVSTSLTVSTVAAGRRGAYLGAVMASLVVTTVAVLSLAPRYGSAGAALGWATGELTGALLLVLLAAKIAHKPPN
ncbi:lipopolysaccharide biosynthesis protein [Serinicoccus profundi]|uniref:lipopolysaccharide biosynthesis protein n=1 Tax=Serinicoccus profundi TaxID=1078471 RepID=UPI000255E84D|nr:oligosaccharide flippase family protein [Serinicoccus profundi]